MQPGTSRDTDGVNAGPAGDSTINPAQPVRSRERGQTTAEFVVILPFLLLFLFLIVDFGWLLKNWIVVTNTARESARCAVVNDCDAPAPYADSAQGIILARLNAGLTGNLGDIDTDIYYIDEDGNGNPSSGDSLIVCLKANNEYISPVMPFLSFISGDGIPDPMPLAAREEMRIERPPTFAPAPTQIASNSSQRDCDF
jgi:hypothetical protein